MKTHSRVASFALAALALAAAAGAQQTLQSKSASFYRSWSLHPRFDLLGYDIDLKETRATLDFYAGTSKVDLRNLKGRIYGAPPVLHYASYARARAPITLFGRNYELASFSASAIATHGIHGNDPSLYVRWAPEQPRLARSFSLRFFGRNQALPTTTNVLGATTVSVPTQTATVYENTWQFVVPPGIPIAIEGSVELGWSLSASGTAKARISTSYNSFTGTGGDSYMSEPQTSLQASHQVVAYGDCDGIVGIPGLGVGLGHEIHVMSPVRPAFSMWSSYRGMGGSMSVSVKPLILKTYAVVKYLFGEKSYYFPTLSTAWWTPLAKQLF